MSNFLIQNIYIIQFTSFCPTFPTIHLTDKPVLFLITFSKFESPNLTGARYADFSPSQMAIFVSALSRRRVKTGSATWVFSAQEVGCLGQNEREKSGQNLFQNHCLYSLGPLFFWMQTAERSEKLKAPIGKSQIRQVQQPADDQLVCEARRIPRWPEFDPLISL